MNRIIKFRAWDVEHKRWLIKGELENVGHYEYGSVVPNALVLQDERNEQIVLMQFTGLLDKNGKEIYQSAQVRYMTYRFGKDGKDEKKEQFGEVVWQSHKGRWFINWENPIDYIAVKIEIDANDQLEVVGNIYENPELLTN